MYTDIHTSALCTEVRTTVYVCGRGLRGPVGVGWCACDMSNIINHHLAGLGVVVLCCASCVLLCIMCFLCFVCSAVFCVFHCASCVSCVQLCFVCFAVFHVFCCVSCDLLFPVHHEFHRMDPACCVWRLMAAAAPGCRQTTGHCKSEVLLQNGEECRCCEVWHDSQCRCLTELVFSRRISRVLVSRNERSL